jgi:hypothetical protein
MSSPRKLLVEIRKRNLATIGVKKEIKEICHATIEIKRKSE